jgi:iron complex outermembrane recepter protein
MKVLSFKSGLMLGVAFTGATFPTLALAQESGSSAGLEEIVVTAQKREQSLQDVPIAVTAVTEDTLQANRITTVNDLSSIAPGVTVRPSAGGSQIPAFVIRGQQSYGVVAGSDKQVSIYLDGVYISSPRGSIFDLPDVQRIEVLRGPQGTLFGRNATAGAISVSTRDPTGEARIRAEGSMGNYDSYRFRISGDLPQMGPFSAYFSFMRNYRRGDIQNAAAGTIWDRTLSSDPYYAKVKRSPRWLGTIDSNSYFGAVKFEPSDSFRMVYKYDRNEDNGTPEGQAFIGGYVPNIPSLGPLGPVIQALYDSQNIYQNNSDEAPGIVTNGFAIPRELRVQGHSLTATWQATDQITVKNIAAYRKSRIFAASAIDGVAHLTFTEQALLPLARVVAPSVVPNFVTLPPAFQQAALAQVAAGLRPTTVGGRVILSASGATSATRQWSNELQVNYSSDNLQLTLGALWFQAKDEAGGPEGMQNTVGIQQTLITPYPASGVIPLGNEGRYFNKATSLAAYAQAEYKFNDQLELVAGGRITHDKKSSLFDWDIRLPNGTIVDQPSIVPPVYKKTKPNYMIGLNWTPNEDTLVYGKYSTSFVSGGSVAGIEFVPEEAKSWELGAKVDFFGRRLRTNLALFYVDYENFQGPSSTTSPDAVAALIAQYGDLGRTLAPVLSTFVQQANDIRAKGVEFEVTAAPAEGLVIGGSVSYTDIKFLNIRPSFLAAQGGQYLPAARPAWTGSAYASYETQPLFGDATLALRTDALYQSGYRTVANPDVQRARGVPDEHLSVPGYWKVNARAALKNVNIGGIDTEFAIWGRNLTDTRYRTSTLFLPWGNTSTYEPPRTYGVDVIIQF